MQKAQVAEAESGITATGADVERTRDEAARQRALLATSFGTRQKVEQAIAAEKRLAATLVQQRGGLDGQRRQMAVLDTQELQLRADIKAKRAALDLAKINLGYTRIIAPVNGKVSERGVRAGHMCTPGTGDLGRAARQCLGRRELQGDPADACRDRPAGRDSRRHLPGSGRQGACRQHRTGERLTVQSAAARQRDRQLHQGRAAIPVKLRLDPDNPLRGHLRPGMSVVATIMTDTTPPPP